MTVNQPTTDDLLAGRPPWWSQPLLLCGLLLIASLSPLILFRGSTHLGNADIHAVMEMCGSLVGLMAGLAIISRFYALGNRLHLFIGLAFVVNAAEDLAHGALAFEVTHNLLKITDNGADLARFIPGTYVTGRLLFGIILIFAPLLASWMAYSQNPRKDTVIASFVTLVATISLTAIAFTIPLPKFMYPDQFISRPIDFFSAIVIGLAFIIHYGVYKRNRDYMHIWVLLAIAIDFSGQITMSFSRQLYDLNFDIAHLCKLLGYIIPMLGFCVYHIQIVKGIEANKNELMQLTKELEIARGKAEFLARKAERSSLAKSSYLATMSHEFRTPLNAIMGFTARLLKKVDKEMHPRQLDALWSINRNGQHLREVVDSVLDISKIEAGKMDYNYTKFRLGRVCQEVTQALEPLASSKGLALTIDDLKLHSFVVEADRMKIKQVVTNLVSNAIKYTDHGSVSIRLDGDSSYPGSVLIRVTDTGIGIKPEDKERLFQPFEQIDSVFDKRVGGTGLGLVLSAGLVAGHGGKITVDSVADEGSVFTIVLPWRKNQDDAVNLAT